MSTTRSIRTSPRDAHAPGRDPAARVLGHRRPASWSTIAAGLVVPVDARGIHPEFCGYGGQLVKQADVTMLQYPWGYPMPAKLARQRHLNYYVPRTDPGGPSMSDAINPIDTAALGTPRLRELRVHRAQLPAVHPRRVPPVLRDPTGGAFTFMTGIGGFLQEFLYGYSGMRWNSGQRRAQPSLNEPDRRHRAARPAVARARTFTVAIGPQRTTVALVQAAAHADQDAAGSARCPPRARADAAPRAGPT